MKLEAGKRYVLRCGMITPPIINTFSEDYFGLGDSTAWEADGKSYIDAFDLDIVSEYIEPSQDIDRMRFELSKDVLLELVSINDKYVKYPDNLANLAVSTVDALIERLKGTK